MTGRSPTLARLASLREGTYAPKIRARGHLPARAEPGPVEVTVPMRIQSTLNKRECWQARHSRAQSQRDAVRKALDAFVGPVCHIPKPLTVRLVRIASRELDDDNLPAGFKSVRDEIADWLGVDDRLRDVVRYAYGQEKGRGYSIRIEICRGIREA